MLWKQVVTTTAQKIKQHSLICRWACLYSLPLGGSAAYFYFLRRAHHPLFGWFFHLTVVPNRQATFFAASHPGSNMIRWPNNPPLARIYSRSKINLLAAVEVYNSIYTLEYSAVGNLSSIPLTGSDRLLYLMCFLLCSCLKNCRSRWWAGMPQHFPYISGFLSNASFHSNHDLWFIRQRDNFYSPLRCAMLIKRYKHFLSDVISPEEKKLKLHCGNTGAISGYATPGDIVLYSTSDNPKCKYAHSWELTHTQKSDYICINTLRANTLVCEGIKQNLINKLFSYSKVLGGVKYGSENSCIDLLLQANHQVDFYIEGLLVINEQCCFLPCYTVALKNHSCNLRIA